MRHFILSAAILLVFTLPAQAQGKGGLSYTTKGAGRTDGHMNFMAPKYPDEKKELKPYGAKEDPPPTEEEEAAAKTWDKYKALAAGKYEKKEAPGKPLKAEITVAPKAEVNGATGLSGILEQYHKNKAQRSQMRVIRVTTPEAEKKTEESKEESKEEKPDESAEKSK